MSRSHSAGADGEAVKKLESSAIPLLASLLHHCKVGWPSDSENIAKHPLIARPGWFSDESKRKTTPAASASVASPNFLQVHNEIPILVKREQFIIHGIPGAAGVCR